MENKASFIKRIQVWGILLLLGFGLGLICIDVYQSYRDFNTKVHDISKEYHERHRQIIRQEVMRVVEMIEYQKSQVETLTREKIKSRAYEAHAVASRLYKESTLKPDMTRYLAIEALRSIRYAGGTGYFFATTMKGVEILFADRPQLEGQDLRHLQDTRGKHVVIDMIEIIRQRGEGFYEYYWTKPGSEGSDYKKISFIKRFEPWNGFIGTGLYVNDIETREKAELLARISRIRFGKEGYIFINRFNGDALVSNGSIFSGTKKLWEVFPESPEKMKDIFHREYDAAQKKEGGYIRYAHIKLNAPEKKAEKVSFIYGFKPFDWIIGAGVYLDDVEQELAAMEAELNRNITSKLINFTLTGALFIGLFFVVFSRMHHGLKEDLGFLILFFRKAVDRDQKIDRNQIKFSEFDQVASYANQMLMDRSRALRDLKTTRDSLERNEERLRVALASAKAGTWEWDLSTDVNTWSEELFHLYGADSQEITPSYDNWQKFIHPEDWPEVEKTVRNAVKGQKEISTEWRVHNPSGPVTWLMSRGQPQFDDQGNLTRYVGIVVDITDRRTAEQNYQMLFRQMLDGFALHEIISNDRGTPVDYRFLAVNPAFESMTGLKADAILNKTVLEVIPDIEPYWIDTYGRVTMTGEPVTFESHTAALGKDFQVTAFRPAPGQFACIFVDITDRKQAVRERERLQRRLNQAQKMESIGNLAGGIAHDFNNILFPIIGMSELLMEDLPAGSTEHENAEEILKAGKRGAELVKQILAFSRQTEHKRTTVRPQQILKEVIKLVRSTIPATIKIHQHLQEDCGVIMADPTQIHQVAMNLVTNAFHAMEEETGEISIILREEELPGQTLPETLPGRFAVLSVSDTGGGIPSDLKDKIFEPYFTTKQEGKGTGLGLSVVYGIVKEHGGHVRVDSRMGKGSRFTVYLPITSNDAPYQHIETGQHHPTGTETILLVDDEASVLQIEKQMLQRLGYRVTAKASSPDALAAFKANPLDFDLVLTDMTMPDMAGDRLAECIIAIRPEIPVIICTGFSKGISRETVEASGITGYLSKPVVWSELAETIRNALDDTR